MLQYQNLLSDILKNGVIEKNERTGTGTKKVFGRMLTFDLSKGFPLLTTKKMFTKGIIYELLWMISGNSNIQYLVQNGVNIWNEWPYQNYINKNIEKAKEIDKGRDIKELIDEVNGSSVLIPILMVAVNLIEKNGKKDVDLAGALINGAIRGIEKIIMIFRSLSVLLLFFF